MAVALWNERDPILKERMFGLSNREGNHGEDVKEHYFYLDNTPTHSYARMLYKYPQVAFPYSQLVAENMRRSSSEPEFELFDAIGDAFRQQRYFDVFVEYAKIDGEDLLCRISVVNRGPDEAAIHVLPHLWYRNTWSWNHDAQRHSIRATAPGAAHTTHPALGDRWWYVRAENGSAAGVALHRKRHERRKTVRIGQSQPVRQRWHQRRCRVGSSRSRKPRQWKQSRSASARGRARRRHVHRAGSSVVGSANPSVRRVRRHDCRTPTGSRRLLLRHSAARR